MLGMIGFRNTGGEAEPYKTIDADPGGLGRPGTHDLPAEEVFTFVHHSAERAARAWAQAAARIGTTTLFLLSSPETKSVIMLPSLSKATICSCSRRSLM
jgi:hypothetical protein